MIAKTLLLLAQAAPPDLNDPAALRKAARPGGAAVSTELLVVLGCALALSALLFVWAFFIRKRPKTARGALVVERRKGSHHEDDEAPRRKRKRRPDHPDNWGRNPTLGETGGLPPAREDGPAETGSGDDPDLPSSGDGSHAVRPR